MSTVQLGRRLTLADLYAVVLDSNVTLEYSSNDPTDADTSCDDLVTKFQSLSLEQSCSRYETLAILTVWSMQLSVGKLGEKERASLLAGKLVNLVNKIKKADSVEALLLPNDLEKAADLFFSDKKILAVVTAELALSCFNVAYAARLAQASLPIAVLSLEASGYANQLYADTNVFSEYMTEIGRPHRSIGQAAAAVRVLINGSKFSKEDANDIVKASNLYGNIPHIQGPAYTDLQAASQRLEVELNSPVTGNDEYAGGDKVMTLDKSLVDASCQQAVLAIQKLLTASRERQGQPENSNDTKQNVKLTSDLVESFQQELVKEVTSTILTIKEELQKATEAAHAKEQAKADRSVQQQPSQQQDTADEFAGMTEAQIAKIMKKRAEKEAKLAAKKKAKSSGVVSLFGPGTAPLVEIFEKHQQRLTPACMQEWQVQVVEKLLSGGVQRKPKIPKGTRDYMPEQMMIRQQAFNIIRRVFQSHGAVEIDTPVFELKDTLTGKYGEDSKLIYDLADQGGELLALRYDLTVPFARFLALNSVGNIKRFHIGKVYRRDQPALARGRYREFYQCDFDIAGVYGRMIPDSECVCVACDILDALPIGDFGIKINHRRLLDAILEICGVPADKFRTICSAVDKLDKEPWAEVKREMTQDKGLAEDVADKIGEFVLEKGEPWEMYNKLMVGNKFGKHKGALDAMEDMRILFEYLEAMEKLKFLSFDLSLARGLDYYTGVIYEAVCMSGNTQVGSIGGGGRYDTLVSMFQEAGKQTPCVGVSVGIERVFTLMEARLREEQGGSIKQPNVDILIAAAGGNDSKMIKEKMKIAHQLWKSNLRAEFSQQENAKLKKELQNALDREIPFMVIIGEDELAEGSCVVKDIKAKTEDKVQIDKLAGFLRQKGVIPVGCEFAAELESKE